METELQPVRDLVDAAPVSAEDRQSAQRLLTLLPPLYEKLGRTYESKYGEEAVLLMRRLMLALGGKTVQANAVVNGLVEIQVRLGLPELDLRPLARLRAA